MQPPLAVLQRYPPHDHTLGGLLASRAGENPARTLLRYEGRELSYADFAARVDSSYNCDCLTLGNVSQSI